MAKHEKEAAAPQLFESDERMLEVMEYCITQRIFGMKTKKEWCAAIGFQDANLHNVRSGKVGFTKMHYQAAGALFGVSMDFLFGFTDEMFYEHPGPQNPRLILQKIKAAVAQLEKQINPEALPDGDSEDSGVGNKKRNNPEPKTSKTAKDKKTKPATGAALG